MNYHTTFRRLLAMALTIVIVLGMLPASANAQSPLVGTSGEIISFEILPETTAAQTVPLGTPLGDLDLPQTLQATIYLATDTDVPKVEETVVDSGESEQNEVISVPVGWASSPDYNGDAAGVYAFTAALPTEYALAEDVGLPKIFVTVEEPSAIPAMSLMGASPEANVTTEAELKTIFESGGTAILGADIMLTGCLEVKDKKEVTLDLNGKTIDRGLSGNTASYFGNAITVTGSLTLSDSVGSGKITGGMKGIYIGGGGIYVNGGTFVMNGGSIIGNTTSANGGGVFVDSGSFEMNGGTISGNTSTSGGGGVCVGAGGTFTMSAGVISCNTTAGNGGGVYAYGGKFVMNGGTVSGNTAAGSEAGKGHGGGAAVMFGGSFIMHNGEIDGNTAKGYSTAFGEGGGVFVNMSGSFTMDGGKISGNEAYYGGGVCLTGIVYNGGDVSSFIMSAGEISENTTDSASENGNGGGVYVEANGNLSIKDSKIIKNSAGNGGGVYMLNGTCTMENSEISENTTFSTLEELNQGGGVLITGGVFTMKSGKINLNKAANGGGVLVVQNGVFTMESGQINENSTYALEYLCNGGGVYVNKDGTFDMKGGEIRGNATSAWYLFNHGGGVYVYDGTFMVSGAIAITDNSRSGIPNNVYLKTDTSEIAVVGALTGVDGAIGISTRTAPEGTTSLTVAKGVGYTIDNNDFKKFARDAGGALSLGDNIIELPNPNTSYLTFLSYNANGGSGIHNSSAIVEGMNNHLTVASVEGFSRTNCSFAGWNTAADGSGNGYQAGDELILTTNTVLYAQWKIDKAMLTVTAPQGGAAPISSATCSPTGITTVLAWKQNETPLTGNFNYNMVYSVEITLTAGTGCKFSGAPEGMVNGAAAVVQRNSDTELVVSYTFAKTDPRSAPKAALAKTTINVANTGGAQPLTLNVANIIEGCNAVTWTMSKTEDGGNILTLPDITTGTLSNGSLSLGSFTVASNAAGQPTKSAKVTISFGGNESGDYAGIPISLTVTFQLAVGASPDAQIDFVSEKIIGVSSEMEYIVTDSAGAPADWIAATTVTGIEFPIGGIIPAAGSASRYIHICYKNIAGSSPKTIAIPARPNLAEYLDWDSWVDNNIENDVESGYVPEDFSYRINNGPDMSDSSESWLQIPLQPSDTLTFWMPATAAGFKSAEITVTAPPRLAKPVVTIDFSAGKLNTTSGMEYRLNETADWTTCTPNMAATDFGWNGTEPVNVWFRYPCTKDNYASEAQTLIIPDASCTAAKSAAQDASYADMTQAAATDENAIKAALKSTAETAVDNSSITVTINKVSFTAPAAGTSANPSGTNGSYTFTVTVSKGSQSETTEQKTIIITATTYTGGNGGNGNAGGSDTPSKSTDTKPTEPVTGSTENKATVDNQGNASVSLTDKNITDAIADAKAEAAKKGVNAGDITAVIHVTTGGKNADTVTVNLHKTTQEQVIGNKVASIQLVIDRPDLTIGIDLAAVTEINRQAKADVQLSATRMDNTKLSGDAKAAIGSRPAYDLKALYGSGKSVTDFGKGSVSVEIPYTLQKGEIAGNVCAVYVDAKGKVTYLTDSSYNTKRGAVVFSTSHFSTYGVAYKASFNFTDINGHWAKDDILFVANRGLMTGTGAATFSPNGSMTRGMFVTALGRLANADISAYQQSSFTDVKTDAYYMGYIEWGVKNNILVGIGGGKVDPDGLVTREQMAVIMDRYATVIGFKLLEVHAQNVFADNAKIGAWAAPSVKRIQMADIIQGKNGNLFDPQGTATRAEVSAVLRRFVELAIFSDTA